jgi:hypothetical protein
MFHAAGPPAGAIAGGDAGDEQQVWAEVQECVSNRHRYSVYLLHWYIGTNTDSCGLLQ